jgi:hypothetical protein
MILSFRIRDVLVYLLWNAFSHFSLSMLANASMEATIPKGFLGVE